MSKTSPDFQQYIDKLRSDDALAFEDGFHSLLPRVREFRDELVRLLQVELDPRMRGRLVELLGETEDASLVEILRAELESGKPEVVQWTLTALERIGHQQIANEYRRAHAEYD